MCSVSLNVFLALYRFRTGVTETTQTTGFRHGKTLAVRLVFVCDNG